MTSGTQSGKPFGVFSQTSTGVVQFFYNLPGAPAIGDTYKLYRPYSIDGVHPSTFGHAAVANFLNTSANLAKVI